MDGYNVNLSPFARRLLGAEEEPSSMMDIEAGDQAERSPSADDPGGLGYTLALKRKRQAAILRQMMQRAGMDDLARMTAIREDHGGSDHD